jgi:hypothetical protein
MRERQRLHDPCRRLSRQLRPVDREGSPAGAAGIIHLRSLPYSESDARSRARTASHEPRRLRSPGMAPCPNDTAIHCRDRKGLRRRGNRAGSSGATNRWQPSRRYGPACQARGDSGATRAPCSRTTWASSGEPALIGSPDGFHQFHGLHIQRACQRDDVAQADVALARQAELPI